MAEQDLHIFSFFDVLVFDFSYKTNKLRMPVVSFTGVNNRQQSILFGGAFLEDDTSETSILAICPFS